MTAVMLTPATAAGTLLTELRELLDRHAGASTLDDARELADDLTAALRRTRGSLRRLTRKAEPAPKAEPAEPKPANLNI